MSEPALSTSESASRVRWLRGLLWLGASLLAVLVLSVTGSYAPVPLKRLILFYGIFGIACGVVLRWLRAEIQPPGNRWVPVAGLVLCALGAVNLAGLSYRQFAQARQALAQQHPQELAAIRMAEKLEASDPQAMQRYAEERRKYEPRFTDYLAHRVSGLGAWKSPWPEIFWGGEVALAGILCGLTLRRARVNSTPPA